MRNVSHSHKDNSLRKKIYSHPHQTTFTRHSLGQDTVPNPKQEGVDITRGIFTLMPIWEEKYQAMLSSPYQVHGPHRLADKAPYICYVRKQNKMPKVSTCVTVSFHSPLILHLTSN